MLLSESIVQERISTLHRTLLQISTQTVCSHGKRHESIEIMHHSRKQKRQRGPTRGQVNLPEEQDYMQVDDPEDLRNVSILPAMPINHESDYADRDSPRSGSSPRRPSGNVHTSPITPPRGVQRTSVGCTGPYVNRNLKPVRGRTSFDLQLQPKILHQVDKHICLYLATWFLSLTCALFSAAATKVTDILVGSCCRLSRSAPVLQGTVRHLHLRRTIPQD
ncbi:uncharacterized protein ACB058_012262 [Synchiropus picturatus]